jgi:hypothetical protein
MEGEFERRSHSFERRAAPHQAVQKLLPVPGGLKTYEQDPSILVTDESRACPICPDGHRLRSHGYYHRTAILLADHVVGDLPVVRLFCAVTGRTVSLLPDFCIPRHQHGPEVLGTFLHEHTVAGRPLVESMRQARPSTPCHAVAQSLLAGFRRRDGPIRAYLARIQPRTPVLAAARLREVAQLVVGLCTDFTKAAIAFLSHGPELHRIHQVGLA